MVKWENMGVLRCIVVKGLENIQNNKKKNKTKEKRENNQSIILRYDVE